MMAGGRKLIQGPPTSPRIAACGRWLGASIHSSRNWRPMAVASPTSGWMCGLLEAEKQMADEVPDDE